MYMINKKENKLSSIDKKSFSNLKFKERQHLQEWIAKEPTFFGEELLIIQKEFNGFSDTNERLDLLALDKQGNLVLIENKLDDSGRDVTWQSLKYASYCSSLSRDEIKEIYQDYLDKYCESEKDSKTLLIEFFGGNIEYDELPLNKGYGQRIILVAANFRKEVTSTVLWLRNYDINVQCFKIAAYQHGSDIFLNVDQIIPVKDAEEFMIKISKKNQESIIDNNIENLKLEFWKQFLKKMNVQTDLFKSVNAIKSSRISTKTISSDIVYQFGIAKTNCRIELYIDTGDKLSNEEIFDKLFKSKNDIENKFGNELSWERCDNYRACKIVYKLNRNAFNKDEWNEVTDLMINKMIAFDNAINDELKKNIKL